MAPQTMPESPSGAYTVLNDDVRCDLVGSTMGVGMGARPHAPPDSTGAGTLNLPQHTHPTNAIERPKNPGDWRVSLLAAKGVKGAFDNVELTLEGKTTTFDVDAKKGGSGDEVVRRVD